MYCRHHGQFMEERCSVICAHKGHISSFTIAANQDARGIPDGPLTIRYLASSVYYLNINLDKYLSELIRKI